MNGVGLAWLFLLCMRGGLPAGWKTSFSQTNLPSLASRHKGAEGQALVAFIDGRGKVNSPLKNDWR